MSVVQPNVIELHFADEGGQVRVVPPDRDIMAMPIEAAIEACRAFKRQIAFKDQFDLLLDRLAQWISERQEKLSRAYLTTRDAGLLFLVALEGGELDQEIEDDLTALDVDIANDDDYSLVSLSVLAIPSVDDESIQAFLSADLVLRYRTHVE